MEGKKFSNIISKQPSFKKYSSKNADELQNVRYTFIKIIFK
jgi:hypothetical protein